MLETNNVSSVGSWICGAAGCGCLIVRLSAGAGTAVGERRGLVDPPCERYSYADFDQRVLLFTVIVVLVYFWATWRPPCCAIAPALEQLAGEFSVARPWPKLDAGRESRVMSRFGAERSTPTPPSLRAVREVDRLVGLRPKLAIKQALERVA